MAILSEKMTKDDVRYRLIQESKLTPILEDLAELVLSSKKKVSKDDSYVRVRTDEDPIETKDGTIEGTKVAR